ncbi:hypothetical protein C8F04DRAFT_1185749 [Mycena alexandri]|uniref:Uncharacterized protein n=1 Tax=Mycena alexandri TaxID=1745969 RepID=A0AAD6X1P8_9AGAR|nr:hypothetical protein C8F04DRAFT_1185749 [Mycena alexandri]
MEGTHTCAQLSRLFNIISSPSLGNRMDPSQFELFDTGAGNWGEQTVRTMLRKGSAFIKVTTPYRGIHTVAVVRVEAQRDTQKMRVRLLNDSKGHPPWHAMPRLLRAGERPEQLAATLTVKATTAREWRIMIEFRPGASSPRPARQSVLGEKHNTKKEPKGADTSLRLATGQFGTDAGPTAVSFADQVDTHIPCPRADRPTAALSLGSRQDEQAHLAFELFGIFGLNCLADFVAPEGSSPPSRAS